MSKRSNYKAIVEQLCGELRCEPGDVVEVVKGLVANRIQDKGVGLLCLTFDYGTGTAGHVISNLGDPELVAEMVMAFQQQALRPALEQYRKELIRQQVLEELRAEKEKGEEEAVTEVPEEVPPKETAPAPIPFPNGKA